MKKRKLKKWVKNLLVLAVFYSIFLGFLYALYLRTSSLDAKKELPVTTQSNSMNY